MTETAELIARYYAAFNAGDTAAMLACLSDDVRHDVNQGGARHGKAAVAAFCAHMARCCREKLTDIVILTAPSGTRAAAESTVEGAYLAPTRGCPRPRARPTGFPPAPSSRSPAAASPGSPPITTSKTGPGRSRDEPPGRPLTGDALGAALPEVARLRIAVFRACPYLCGGDLDYEERDLAAYAASPGAIVVGAFDGERLVGAATSAPMGDHAREFAGPFAARGFDLADIFYCGESVLMPEYRGRGVGHAFFDHREAQGRALGRRWACLCAVMRPADHPLRPEDYAPLDPFWRKRGYARMAGLVARFPWKELGDKTATK